MTLTDTQLVLLSAAAQHEEHLVTPPAALNGRAAQNALKSLIRRSLVEEQPVSAQQPHWRTGETGQLIGLRITSAGLAALGLDPTEQTDADPADQRATAPQPQVVPRSGTKQDLLLRLLSREQGATINDLMAAAGWLAHTTRAALTGLRKKGYAIERIKGEDGSSYRVHAAAEEVR
ncbi:DUF3489 domain-containing protein [Microvirga yunnanensis]|uniref:DUF3489 domain-containing protein n=1 Tax=Microvirga yunnanensis TaxID=2953740 RepID=UPI0021C719A7|nr:DUF3489 domain-containing protein [Microvirga sp. HBU65207]